MNVLDVYTGWNFDTPVNINSIYTQGWFNFNVSNIVSTNNTDIYTGWNFDTPVNINSIYTHGWFRSSEDVNIVSLNENTDIYTGWNFDTPVNINSIYTHGWFRSSEDVNIVSLNENTDIYTGWNFDTPVNINSIYTHGWFRSSEDVISTIFSGQGQLILNSTNINAIGIINYNVYDGNSNILLNNVNISGTGYTTIPIHLGNGVVNLDNIVVNGLYDITIINVSASIPIISRVSNLIKVRTSMFDNYTSTFNGMSNNTNMPNGYLTKCGTLYNNERKVYSSMVTEMYNQHGVCLTYYIVTYDVNYNRIFGEDNNKRFERVFDVMGYYQLPREEKIWNKFGIEGADEVTIFISKKHFQDASTYGNNLVQGNIGINTYSNYIPKIGDIIKSNFNKYIYEVTEVKEESGMFLQSKQHVWEIIVRPYKFEHVNVTPSTSASLSDVLVYTSGAKDIFDTKTEVTEKVTEDIAYIPQSTEKANNDPFAGW